MRNKKIKLTAKTSAEQLAAVIISAVIVATVSVLIGFGVLSQIYGRIQEAFYGYYHKESFLVSFRGRFRGRFFKIMALHSANSVCT